MKVYYVGGCVRDTLLDIEPKDIDYVVVGATEQEMLDLGFAKVGSDFPVFLHPKTKDEWALARKERKTGVGYNGFTVEFDPTVTLEEDLARRDLTINAMAMDIETGEIIDPFGGQLDLAQEQLRHVSDAFAEDPVRVLRTCRFAARYGFMVHRDTHELMANIVHELDHVPQERIWAEIEKGLSEKDPLEMFQWLYACGAFEIAAMKVYSGVDAQCLGAVGQSTPMYARFTACASHFTDKDYEKHRIPSDLARVAKAFNSCVEHLLFYSTLPTNTALAMLERLRAFSSPELVNAVLDCLQLVKAKGVAVDGITAQVQADIEAVKTVDAAELAASCISGTSIRDTLFAARLDALNLVRQQHLR